MTRLNLARILVAWTLLSTSLLFAQDDRAHQGGTVRGRITDTTEMQTPIEDVRVVILAADNTKFTTTTNIDGEYERSGIPPGRYLVSIYKEGYGDRLGKPVTVVRGGDHFIHLKMSKKNNPLAIFKKLGALFWIVLLCGLVALVTFVFTKRWITEKQESNFP